MNDFKRYAHAPIVEAVLDIQVKVPDGTSLALLAGLGDAIKQTYPTRLDRMQVESEMSSTGEDIAVATRQSKLGFIYVSTDERQSVQSRLDGFTFGRLAPYSSWDVFSAEAHKLWDQYRAIVPVETITRIGLRYVNRLDLPLPLSDFKDYLRTVPEISPDLPQGLSGYFMQLQVPIEAIAGTLVLNQAMLPPSSPNVVSVLLDIDLFRNINIPKDEDAVWHYFDTLRTHKNQIFEACITDKTKELIS